MLTVMIVDDDPLLCTAMRRKIEMIDRENQLGIQETLIAHSAQEAWGILQEKSVDILISDIRMPYQTGLELADKVNEAFPEIQVVILSGHDDYEYMRSALRSGRRRRPGRLRPQIFRGGNSPRHRRPCPHGAISWRCR